MNFLSVLHEIGSVPRIAGAALAAPRFWRH
jgi:hypothetical protein